MSLDPRAIALQGLGGVALFVALQGLVVPTTEPPTEPREVMIGSPTRPRPAGFDIDRLLREDDELLLLIAASLHLINR